VAVKGVEVPLAMLGFGGVTPIDTRVAAVTVSGVEPETPLKVAVMLVEPCADAVASPLEPAVLLMLAVAGAEEFQLTAVVRFCVEPSL